MMIERFSHDVPEEGARVIQAAALDLKKRNIPLWEGVDLSHAALLQDGESKIITGFIDDVAVAAMIFATVDLAFWPDVPKNTSSFIHKLAVLPSHQGKGLGREMLDYGAAISRAMGLKVTRLDCAADRLSLCEVYESAGYTKVAEKIVGGFPVAFFERVSQ